jgi:hypothetical protein
MRQLAHLSTVVGPPGRPPMHSLAELAAALSVEKIRPKPGSAARCGGLGVAGQVWRVRCGRLGVAG